MLTAKQFGSSLSLFRKYDDAMRNALSECFAYAIHQWHKGKNKNPHAQLIEALESAGGFLSKIAPKLTLGKRDAALDERTCEMRASATIAMLFASREQEKAIREANKAARAGRKAKIDAQNDSVGQDAPKAAQEPSADVVPLAAPGTIESEAIEVHDALVFHGEVLEVSADEAAKLAAYLTQLRMEARKAA